MLAESAKSARWTDVLYTAHTRDTEHIRKVWKAPTLGSLYNLATSQYLQVKHAPPDNPQGVPGLKTRREIINLLLSTAGVEYLGKHRRSGLTFTTAMRVTHTPQRSVLLVDVFS